MSRSISVQIAAQHCHCQVLVTAPHSYFYNPLTRLRRADTKLLYNVFETLESSRTLSSLSWSRHHAAAEPVTQISHQTCHTLPHLATVLRGSSSVAVQCTRPAPWSPEIRTHVILVSWQVCGICLSCFERKLYCVEFSLSIDQLLGITLKKCRMQTVHLVPATEHHGEES